MSSQKCIKCLLFFRRFPSWRDRVTTKRNEEMILHKHGPKKYNEQYIKFFLFDLKFINILSFELTEVNKYKPHPTSQIDLFLNVINNTIPYHLSILLLQIQTSTQNLLEFVNLKYLHIGDPNSLARCWHCQPREHYLQRHVNLSRQDSS